MLGPEDSCLRDLPFSSHYHYWIIIHVARIMFPIMIRTMSTMVFLATVILGCFCFSIAT